MRPGPAIALLTATLAAPPAAPATRVPLPDRLELTVRLDPEAGVHHLEGTLTTSHRALVTLSLADDVQVTELRCDGIDLRDRLGEAAGGRRRLRVPRRCRGDEGRLTLDVRGVGGPSTQRTERLPYGCPHATGGSAVTTDGAVLLPGTAWHPSTGRPTAVELTVVAPSAWTVATSAEPVGLAEAAAGTSAHRFATTGPTHGVAVVAGPRHVRRRHEEGVEISAALAADDAATSERLLAETASILAALSRRLGPPPLAALRVVESGTAASGAFPGLVVLPGGGAGGPRGPARAQLAHFLAHAWWGHAVLPDPSGRPWMEGLAMHAAGPLIAEVEGGPSAARSARRALVAEASLGAGGTAAADALGFETLRRELGDETYFRGLTTLGTAWSGRQAGWADVRSAFESAAHVSLAEPFERIFADGPLPRFSLEDARALDGAFTGTIVHDARSRTRSIDVRLTSVAGTATTLAVRLRGPRTELMVEPSEPLAHVELDPDWTVPRRLAPSELPPSWATTRRAAHRGGRLLTVFPSAAGGASPRKVAAFRELAEALAARHHGRAVEDVTVAEAEWASSSVLVLGSAVENTWTSRLLEAARAVDVDLGPHSFRAGVRRHREPADALLVTVAHPDRPGATVTLLQANGDEALAHVEALLERERVTWFATRRGAPTGSHVAWPGATATRVDLVAGGASVEAASPEARLRAVVERLTAADLEGRETGTAGGGTAVLELARAMQDATLQPAGRSGYLQPFSFVVHDLVGRPSLRMPGPDGRRTFRAAVPAVHSLRTPPALEVTAGTSAAPLGPARASGGVRLPGGLVWVGDATPAAFRGTDLAGAAAVVVDRGAVPLPGTAEDVAREGDRVLALVDAARRRNARALLVLRPEEEAPFHGLLAPHASLPPPALADEVGWARAVGGPRAVEQLMAARQALLDDLRERSDFPVFFGGRELLDDLRAAGAAVPGRRSWEGGATDLRYTVVSERLGGANLVGRAARRQPASRDVVVVAAHLDGPGLAPDGLILPAAVDDAAGVAVALEVGRRLASTPEPRAVLVALLDAGRWGRRGARHFAGAIAGRHPVGGVVVLDAAGERGVPVALSATPGADDLAAVVRRSLEGAGLELAGTDAVARGALEPWIAQGLPAVAVVQASEPPGRGDGNLPAAIDHRQLGLLADAVEAAVRELAGARR